MTTALNTSIHPHLRELEAVADGLWLGAESAVRAVRRRRRAVNWTRTFKALRPGPDTPLWNELARACVSQLTRRGDKAQLARFLGIPRQRLHLLLVAKSACPDAERALKLLAWLANRRPEAPVRTMSSNR